MSAPTLRDRLRSVVGVREEAPPSVTREHHGDGHRRIEAALEGQWWDREGKRFFVIERRLESAVLHGRTSVGEIAACLDEASAEARVVARAPAGSPFIFFDLETIGL